MAWGDIISQAARMAQQQDQAEQIARQKMQQQRALSLMENQQALALEAQKYHDARGLQSQKYELDAAAPPDPLKQSDAALAWVDRLRGGDYHAIQPILEGLLGKDKAAALVGGMPTLPSDALQVAGANNTAHAVEAGKDRQLELPGKMLAAAAALSSAGGESTHALMDNTVSPVYSGIMGTPMPELPPVGPVVPSLKMQNEQQQTANLGTYQTGELANHAAQIEVEAAKIRQQGQQFNATFSDAQVKWLADMRLKWATFNEQQRTDVERQATAVYGIDAQTSRLILGAHNDSILATQKAQEGMIYPHQGMDKATDPRAAKLKDMWDQHKYILQNMAKEQAKGPDSAETQQWGAMLHDIDRQINETMRGGNDPTSGLPAAVSAPPLSRDGVSMPNIPPNMAYPGHGMPPMAPTKMTGGLIPVAPGAHWWDNIKGGVGANGQPQAAAPAMGKRSRKGKGGRHPLPRNTSYDPFG